MFFNLSFPLAAILLRPDMDFPCKLRLVGRARTGLPTQSNLCEECKKDHLEAINLPHEENDFATIAMHDPFDPDYIDDQIEYELDSSHSITFSSQGFENNSLRKNKITQKKNAGLRLMT